MTTVPSVVILGAASEIGLALARVYAKAGYALTLAARNVARLAVDAGDLKYRYGTLVTLAEFDVLDTAGHRRFVQHLPGIPDIAICVVGLLGNQEKAQEEAATADLIMRTNYAGPAIVLNEIAYAMERRGTGTIIGISSVAGERGRASNYIYGSAKAAFSAFLSGLRQRMAPAGVHVITVKPGFVNTRMTAHMRLPRRLTAEPPELARAIYRATRKRVDVIYFYPIWRVIMAIIRSLPEPIFKRLTL